MSMSSGRESYELVQAQDLASSERHFSDAACTKPTLRLPAKLLPPRPRRQFALSLVFPTFIAVFSLAALSILLTQIGRLLPDTDVYTNVDITRFGLHLILPMLKACDLVSTNASTFEQAFTIDLRSSGQISFATAKFIDVVWDLIIGQGGRLLLVWISYVVFMDGLARLMETSVVSYQLYASIVFETSSVGSTWQSFKAVSTGHGWRGRAFFAWFGLATIYVLGYPTLVSASTGYVNPLTIRYRMPDQSLIAPDSEELQHCLQLVNGSAVGLSDGYIVPGPSDKVLEEFKNPTEKFMLAYPLFSTISMRLDVTPHIATNATRMDRLRYYRGDTALTSFTVNGHVYIIKNALGTFPVHELYCYRNETLPIDFYSDAECLSKSYFVWGFSSLLLYILLSLQLVWTLGMFLVWLDANIYSELCRKGRKMRGSFRNALDLAEAVREVLGDELCVYSDQEIVRQLGKSRIGLRFYARTNDTDIDMGTGTGTDVSHIGLSSTRGEKEESQRFRLRDDVLYG